MDSIIWNFLILPVACAAVTRGLAKILVAAVRRDIFRKSIVLAGICFSQTSNKNGVSIIT